MITIPTLAQLYAQIKSDIEAEMSITIPLFGRSWARTFALVQAAKLKLLYLLTAFVQKNIFVDTADPESIGGTLERFGRVKLGRNPFPAQAGQYSVTVTGTIGATIAATTTFKSNDSALNAGRIFQLDTDHVMIAASDTILLRALEAGIGSKLQAGDQLTATAPIALVNSICTVTAEVVQPLASENLEEYRSKTIEAFQLEPQGGAASDYIVWSSDAQGVETVYPYARSGYTSEVNLFVEATLADSSDGKGTPGAAILAEVEEVVNFDPDTTKPLDERGRRPLGMIVNYLPVTILDVDIEVVGYQGLTTAIETQITNALRAALADVRPFVAAANVLANKNDILNAPKITFVIQTAVPASVYDSVALSVDGQEVPSHVFQNGDIPYLSSVTFV